MRRIAQSNIEESNIFNNERLIAQINSIAGMKIIGKYRAFCLSGSQIYHDLSHGRNTVMRRDPGFTWLKRRDNLIRFLCTSLLCNSFRLSLFIHSFGFQIFGFQVLKLRLFFFRIELVIPYEPV